jgi:hypothetical protein
MAKVSVHFAPPIMPLELQTMLDQGDDHLLMQIRRSLETSISDAGSRN